MIALGSQHLQAIIMTSQLAILVIMTLTSYYNCNDKLRGSYNDYLKIAQTMCTPGTVAQIFIDDRMLHIKQLIQTANEHTIPIPLQIRPTVPAYRTSWQKLRRTVRNYVSYCHPCR